MNIFVLGQDLELCAQHHCDQHVSRMIPRYVQILSTASYRRGFDTPCVPTYAEHPCVTWAQESFDNFLWLKDLTLLLNDEYRYRFDHEDDHCAIKTLQSLSSHRFERHGLTPFAQVMPDRYKDPHDPVGAYRNFYIADNLAYARWSLRDTPDWIMPGLSAIA